MIKRAVKIPSTRAHGARGALAALAAAIVAGCATVTTGTSSTLKVETFPTGATCDAEREGRRIGTVSATPGTITVDKSWNTLTITCRKDGHDSATEILKAEAQGATFGNIILGGGIGLIIDASSGAMVRYDDPPMMLLTPQRFPTESARDTFFAQASDEVRRLADTEIERKRKSDAICQTPSSRDHCQNILKERRERRDTELAVLEQKRLAVKIQPEG